MLTQRNLLYRCQMLFDEVYITKSARIAGVNTIVQDLMLCTKDFLVIQSINDTLSVSNTQLQLNKLVAHWMQAMMISDIFPDKVNGHTLSRTAQISRPVLTMKDLLEFLIARDSFCVKKDIVHLLWKYDATNTLDARPKVHSSKGGEKIFQCCGSLLVHHYNNLSLEHAQVVPHAVCFL